MYKFIKTNDKNNSYDISDVEYTIPTNEIDLDNMITEFSNFLRSCGFFFDSIELVNNDEN